MRKLSRCVRPRLARGCAVRLTFLRCAVAGALAITAVAAAPAAAQFSPGSDGLGDPFFPFAGNGGYDVRHYSLDLDYVRTGNQMDATATITAKATENLSSFNLDLRGFNISNLDVDGIDAGFSRSGTHELTITPRRPASKRAASSSCASITRASRSG